MSRKINRTFAIYYFVTLLFFWENLIFAQTVTTPTPRDITNKLEIGEIHWFTNIAELGKATASSTH